MNTAPAQKNGQALIGQQTPSPEKGISSAGEVEGMG